MCSSDLCALAAFVGGQALLKNQAPHATLGQAGVLRAVLMAGAYPALIALIGLGIGAIIRHTAGAICAVVGLVFVLPVLVSPLSPSVQITAQKFLPDTMRNSLVAVRPFAHLFSAGLTFGLLCTYALVALAAGAWALARRDA